MSRIRVGAVDGDAKRVLAPIMPTLERAGMSLQWSLGGGRGGLRTWRGLSWAVGSRVAGARRLTLLASPSEEEWHRIKKQWPRAMLVATHTFDQGDVHPSPPDVILPRVVPEFCYPPGTGADVFHVTKQFHLEARPRLVYLGGYRHGNVLSRLFSLAKRLLSLDGELVLLDSISVRAGLAPALQRLGLAENTVFLPEDLPDPAMAGVLLGADLCLALDPNDTAPGVASWAIASGIPIVAQDSRCNQAIFGPTALYVYDESVEVFLTAAQNALNDRVVREELMHRQERASEPWKAPEALHPWETWIDQSL